MKKATTQVKALLGAAVVTVFLLSSSCKNEPKQEDTKEVAEEQNEEKFDENEEMEDDSKFLVAAAESDLMEIELGKLAMTKGTSPAVKEFGKQLVDDHTKSANTMKPFAQRLNVTLPSAITEKGREKYNDLNKKSGKEFDEEFAEMMVQNHKDAINKMERAADGATDPEIRSWAASLVPVLRAHLQHAEGLEEKVDK